MIYHKCKKLSCQSEKYIKNITTRQLNEKSFNKSGREKMKKRFGIVMSLLIILLFGTILTGCDPEYGSLSLSLNTEQIQISIIDEKADYYITINNYYDFDAEFDFSFAKPIAYVDKQSVEYKGQGMYKFSVSPLIPESTTLTITLKGLDEKSIEVPVVITREVTSIIAHESLFVVRGSTLKLNNSMFDFKPGDTNLKGLTFEFPIEYAEEYASNNITLSEDFVLSAPEDCPYDSIMMTAISTYDANISTTFEILAINNINTTNFKLKIASQNATNPNAFDNFSENVLSIITVDDEMVLSLDGTNPYYLDLVLSSDSGFQKKLAVDYDLWHKGYETNVSAGRNLLLDGQSYNIVAKKQNFDFIVSASDIGESKITFNVYQANLTQNNVSISLYVKASSKPKQIAINGQVSTGLIELYTNSKEFKEFNFSVIPGKADKNKYNYMMSFYKGDDIEEGFIDEAHLLASTPTDYISVYYGGAKVEVDSATKRAEIDAGQLNKLTSNLTIQAKATTGEEYLAIKLECLEDNVVIASAYMYIKVYVGTTKFEINEQYENGTIYLSLAHGEQTFTGLKVDAGATAGKLTISADSTDAVCDIVQPSTANCDLKITPKKVGQQEFVITTANGLSVVLKVIVIRQLYQDNFTISLKESESEAVANSEINNETHSLSKVVVKGIGSTIKLVTNISGSNDADSNSYSYNLYFTEDTHFNIVDNSVITSLDFTKVYQAMTNTWVEVPTVLHVDLVMYKVENFIRKEQELNNSVFDISLYCVNYIKELSLYASEDSAGTTKEKAVSIYNKGDLSYVNQDLATIYLYLDLQQSTNEDFNSFDYDNFIISSNTPFAIDKTTGNVMRGTGSEVVGNLTLNTEKGSNGYIGKFTYDYKGILAINNINIVFSLTDEYTGVTFSSSVGIEIEKYIDVDSLWLSTPKSVIYLDETPTYQTVSLSVQVLPANAMCTELWWYEETNFTGCIKVDYNPDANILTFTYQSAGKGTIYIFPKSKMKTQDRFDEYGDMYYHLAIDFVCADGKTEQTALKISSYEDLRKMSVDKHYYVDSSIDCKGNIINIAQFNKTLRGTFEPELNADGSKNEKFATSEQIGSINNFKVTANGYSNIGMFRELGNSARIYNLSLTGEFENVVTYDEASKSYITKGFELSETSNIGLLVGVNYGTISNVTVNLQSACNITVKNTSTKNIEAYVGLLAGSNNGTIVVNDNCKTYTLFVNNTINTSLNIDFEKGSDGVTLTSYFGGIAGNNIGTIAQELDQSFLTIGLYGISSNLFVNANADFVAGVAGVNVGTIKGLKATGVMTNTTEPGKQSYVAGFVGKLLGGEIKNNTSRVFVRGANVVAGFIGTKAGDSTIENNIVQATDDGTKISTDASLIVGLGESSTLYAICEGDTLSGVETETYFDRSYPTSITSKYSTTNIDFAVDDNIVVEEQLSKIYYYGDMLKLGGDADKTLVSVNKFAKAEADSFNTNYIKNFILPAYKQAVVASLQSNIDNSIDTLSLLKFARLGSNDGETFFINDIQLELSNLTIANLEAFGKYIDIKGVGSLDVIVLSSLNYQKRATFSIYITNYYEDVKIYEDRNKVSETGNIELLNTQTKTIVFDCYSTNYNYDNTPIALVSNSEVTFDYNYELDSSQELIEAQILGQTGYFKSKGEATTFDGKAINIVSKFIFGNSTYYRYKPNTDDLETYTDVLEQQHIKNVVEYSKNQLTTYVFVSADDFEMFEIENVNSSKLEKTTKLINAHKGVDSIQLSKHLVQAEPTDSIEIMLTYTSYDNTLLGEVYSNNDIITPSLRVYLDYQKDIYTSYSLGADNTFKGISGDTLNKNLFSLSSTQPVVKELIYNNERTEVVAVKYAQTYTLKMSIDNDFDIDVYNYLKDKYIELIFTPSTSTYTQNQANVLIQYTPESITSVLISNYNKNNNPGMIETKDGVTSVYANKVIYSGDQTSIHENNVLNAYVYTKLSEFDYVDVTMTFGQEGGYLAFLEYVNEDENIIGHISPNSVYTSITGQVSLRIYKKYIKIDNANSNTLLISLVYNIPKTVADGTYIPVEFKFYDNQQMIFSNQITLLAKQENQVSFEIYDKSPLNVGDDVLTYQVARGMRYLLDTTIIGYTEEQAVFESSSPNVAYVTKESGAYYLNITQNAINYDSEDYYTVTINSYGQKLEQNKLTTSMIRSTVIRIYEYLVDERNLFDDNTTINLRMKQTVDIREIIAEKINFEYSKTMANTLNDFKQSYIDNASYAFVSETGVEYDLTCPSTIDPTTSVWFEMTVEDDYKIKCYRDLLTNEQHFDFTPLTIGQPCDYSFKVYHTINYEQGKPVIDQIEWDEKVDLSTIFSQTFTINSYVSSSEENATPIYSYANMLAMNDGEYYRLVNDITIKASEFQMITSKPAMFDGNGYTIKITSGAISVNLDNSSSFALFKTIEEGSIFKNINIQIDGNLTMTLNNSLNVSGANIAILVAENNGIITNCSIKSSSVVTADIISTVSVMEKSLFASLCAINSGYITHCQIECNLTASGASLGGVVAENNGDIASTYIRNSRLYNTSSTTNENIVSGGFVCKNSGTINMCYIEGNVNSSRIYCDYTTNDFTLNSKIIYTATKVAGFVYDNSGEIYDSYSNIPIVSTNMCSGFVGIENGGTIKRVFSLCKLKSNDTLNFGFVMSYDQEETTFDDCFFVIQNNLINYNTSETNYTTQINGGAIYYTTKIMGVRPLELPDFNIVEKVGNSYQIKKNTPFANFIVDNIKEQGVWFYSFDETQERMNSFDVLTYSCEVAGITDKNGKAQSFNARRLQLVSPNIIAYSQYELDIAGENESQEHTYLLSSSCDALGSKNNPYIITSAREFEEYCDQTNRGTYEYFRLVCDVDFEQEGIYTTNLYNKTLVGYFEGNGFDVTSYAVNSITSNLSAGLFAQVGKQGTTYSCIKNINFAPTYINLPNSIYVGGVAGSLVNANAYNISIVGENVVIVGRNVVGGIFGRTIGETTIKLIYADITAKASKYSTLVLQNREAVDNIIEKISYNENGANKTDVSYAGAIVGYAGGVAEIVNVSIGANTRTQGMIAGLMFGGVGAITTISDFDLQINSHINQVVAYAFAGLVAGENKGEIRDFTINSNIIGIDTFACEPIPPIAVGGVAGLSISGVVDNMQSKDGYSVIGGEILSTDNNMLNPYNQYMVKYVGGIYGYADVAYITDVTIGRFDFNTNLNEYVLEKDFKDLGLILMGGNYVGSLVGYIEDTLNEVRVEGSQQIKCYLRNTTISNNKVNLISQKEYLDIDEQLVTHNVYYSYFNTAVGDSLYTISTEHRVGLVYGGATRNDGYELGRLANNEENEKSNIIVRSQQLIVYHAEYALCDLKENSNGATTGNLNIDKNIYDFLVFNTSSYYNYFINTFGASDEIIKVDESTQLNNLYIKVVDLKTSKYNFALWSDWLKTEIDFM